MVIPRIFLCPSPASKLLAIDAEWYSTSIAPTALFLNGASGTVVASCQVVGGFGWRAYHRDGEPTSESTVHCADALHLCSPRVWGTAYFFLANRPRISFSPTVCGYMPYPLPKDVP